MTTSIITPQRTKALAPFAKEFDLTATDLVRLHRARKNALDMIRRRGYELDETQEFRWKQPDDDFLTQIIEDMDPELNDGEAAYTPDGSTFALVGEFYEIYFNATMQGTAKTKYPTCYLHFGHTHLQQSINTMEDTVTALSSRLKLKVPINIVLVTPRKLQTKAQNAVSAITTYHIERFIVPELQVDIFEYEMQAIIQPLTKEQADKFFADNKTIKLESMPKLNTNLAVARRLDLAPGTLVRFQTRVPSINDLTPYEIEYRVVTSDVKDRVVEAKDTTRTIDRLEDQPDEGAEAEEKKSSGNLLDDELAAGSDDEIYLDDEIIGEGDEGDVHDYEEDVDEEMVGEEGEELAVEEVEEAEGEAT